jgi:hypothetical protein
MNPHSKIFFLYLWISLALLPAESGTSFQEQLAKAVEAEDITLVTQLLGKGVGLDFSYTIEKNKITPFQHDIFKYSYTTKKLTPLISAILTVNKELFDLLLSNGANVQSRENPPMKWVLHGISAFNHPRAANSFSFPFSQWYELQKLVHIRRYMASQLLLQGARVWVSGDEGERYFLLEAAYQADQQTGTTQFEKMIPSRRALLERGHSDVGNAMIPIQEWILNKSRLLAIRSQDVSNKKSY